MCNAKERLTAAECRSVPDRLPAEIGKPVPGDDVDVPANLGLVAAVDRAQGGWFVAGLLFIKLAGEGGQGLDKRARQGLGRLYFHSRQSAAGCDQDVHFQSTGLAELVDIAGRPA